jgi:uncharacterized membrane protein
MLKIIWVVPAVLALAGCEDMTQQQMYGTAGGAVIGAVATPNNPLQGALIGGTVGLVAGTYLGHDAQGNCVYQRTDGSRYIAACP